MLNYRDPLFSVILFLSLIVFTILVTNFIGSLREKNRVKHLKNFIDKFDFLDDKEVKSIFSENISTNAMILLAIAFEKEGNYEKSLNIYLAILNNMNKNERFTILQNMADVYLKAGFLQKSREAILEILRSKPRDLKALKTLLVVDDKLKNFDEMENIIEIFDELNENIEKEKAYISFQKAIFKNDKERVRELLKEYPILKRDFVTYFIYLHPKEVYDNISSDEVYSMLDIFWNVENLPLKNEAFIQIKGAKKEITTTIKSPIFELEVLKYTPKGLANLEFEYICQNCKDIFPIYEDRCPKCKSLFTFKVEISIVKC